LGSSPNLGIFFLLFFWASGVVANDRGVLGGTGQGRVRGGLETGTSTVFERASAIYEHPTGKHRYPTPRGDSRPCPPSCASRAVARDAAPAHRLLLRVAQVQLRSSTPPCSSTITTSSRQRRATTTGSLQPRLSSSRAAKEGSQTRQITCRCFWGSTTGLPARGACGTLLFRQDKKRKQLPTKNNVEK
jgi:hypothetical protein